MMLRYSFGLADEADTIEAAVDKALNDGHRTADLMGTDKGKPLTCTEMTEVILKNI